MEKEKRVVEDTELNRWQRLKNELEGDYPELEIELWNETQIITILQYNDAAGIHRYWFEKSEISRDLIVYSYEKQKSGWLSQKYIPCLHIQGEMQKSILKFVGTLDNRQNSINILNAMSQQYKRFLKVCDDYLQFAQNHSPQEQLIHEIQRSKELVIKLLGEIKCVINALKNEQQIISSINESDWYIDFTTLIELLEENKNIRGNYFHRSEIQKTAKALLSNKIYTIFSDIRLQLDNNKYLILGNPGTGKTHGIAHLVESLLKENYHIPILFRAKDVNPRNNWADILRKTLGLASDWNEEEIWQALEALSYRAEVNNAYAVNIIAAKIIPKILICIDGLDESKPYDLWHDRLREIEAICQKHPRLRFCITSRPYAFRELEYNDSLLSNIFVLPSDGDVPVNELFDIYIREFSVKVEGCSWIKWSLKTPLALRVFCENYRYKCISGIEKSSVTITNLLSKKFHIIEKEFNSKYETGYGDREYIVQNSLLAIARKFLASKSVCRNELIDSLKVVSGLITAVNDYRRELIDFIEDYGILQSYIINSDTILEPVKTYLFGWYPAHF